MATQQEEVIVRMGMDTTPMRREAAGAGEFMDKFSHKLEHSVNKTLMGIMGISFIHEAKKGIEEFVDWVSKEAAKIFNQDWLQQIQATSLDKQRAQIHKDLLAKWKETEEVEKRLNAKTKERVGLLEELAKQGEAIFDKYGSLEDQLEATSTKIIELRKTISAGDIKGNEVLRATIELKKQQIHFEDLLNKRREQEQKALEARDKANQKLREDIWKGGLGNRKFDSQLLEINRLQEDARLSSSLGNISRARVDMSYAREKMAGIRSQIIEEQRKTTTQTPLEKMVQQLFQDLAPVSDGGIPVKIVDSD